MKIDDLKENIKMFLICDFVPGAGFVYIWYLEKRIFFIEKRREMDGFLKFLGTFVLCSIVPGMNFLYVRSLDKRLTRIENIDLDEALRGIDRI
jgi:hypothetical protein